MRQVKWVYKKKLIWNIYKRIGRAGYSGRHWHGNDSGNDDNSDTEDISPISNIVDVQGEVPAAEVPAVIEERNQGADGGKDDCET